ncbi:MAG: hypothetical protein E6Q59_08065 [Nitrosomonas sp.]|nr:MAG: hypothetical protein E6Q59_08065 [Nitrosomonas sp.]
MDEQKQAVKNFCLDAASNGIYWSVTEVLSLGIASSMHCIFLKCATKTKNVLVLHTIAKQIYLKWLFVSMQMPIGLLQTACEIGVNCWKEF